MAYTTQQLVDIYTRANAGAAPSAATRLTLDAYAQQTQPGGGLSEQAALNQTLSLVNNTTAVAFATYQFFNGAAPSAAGIEFLLNLSTNANDLNDATGVYGSFNQDSRFINFSINLALGGTNAASFATAYGSPVTFRDTVASAYDKIIGNSVAAAAGNDVTAAVNWFSRDANLAALTGFVRANNPTFTAAQIDLAVKAAVIGQILSTAVNTGLGIYAGAVRAAVTDLSDDGLLTGNTAAGLNIIAAYPGTGGGVVGSTFSLTENIDTLVGTNNNDTFNGQFSGGKGTVTGLDSIDGGAGVDTLNLLDGDGDSLDASLLTVKNVEIVNVTSAAGLLAGKLNTTGWAGLTTANVNLQNASTADQAVTVAAGTAVNLVATGVAGKAVAVDGGSNVSVTTTGGNAATGTINIGSTTAAAGVVTVKATGAYNSAAVADVQLGSITVKGGTTVSITQADGITAAQKTAAETDTTNFSVKQGAVNVQGTASTTAVTVVQAAEVTAKNSTGGGATDGVIGVTTGAVTIGDVNYGDNTKAGTITTVTLANGAQTVNSNALTTLELSGKNTVAVNKVAANTNSVKTLAVNVSGGDSTVNENGVVTSATVNAKADSAVTLSAAAATSVTLTGAKALTFTAGTVTALKTVNVTGAGGVTTDLSATGVTKVDASASTGANKVTINGATAKIAYVGGAGSDTVILSGTLDANGSIQLGAGNDRLLSLAGAKISSTTSVVDGGDGIDAISSALISATNASIFKNFEILNLASTLNDIVDVSLLTGSTVTGLELNGGTGQARYSNVTTAQALSVTGAAAGSDATIIFTGVSGETDSYAVTFNAVGGTKATAIDAGKLTVEGIENVVVHSGSASGLTNNTIQLTDTTARTLVIDGSQAATISFGAGGFGTAGSKGATIDASAATGDIKITLTNLGAVTGGSTVKTGAGADTIVVGSQPGQVILTTGAGKDTIDVSGSFGTFSTGATAAAKTTITDFSTTDKIVFGANVGTGVEVFNTTKVDLTGVNDFEAAVAAATAGDGTNGLIRWFEYGNNTYIVHDRDAGAYNAATDIIVKLAGQVDLSTAVFNTATNTFTLV